MKLTKKIITFTMAAVMGLCSSSIGVFAQDTVSTNERKPLIVFWVIENGEVSEGELNGFKAANPGVPVIVTDNADTLKSGEVLKKLKKGDMNADGKIDLQDVRVALQGVLGIEKLSDEQNEQLDIYSQSDAGMPEVQEILKAALGMGFYDGALWYL